jgi:hypothetical protein
VRACLIAVGVAIATAVARSPALAVAPHRSTCLPVRAHTVVTDSSARVFSVESPRRRVRLYGCLFQRGIAVPLGLLTNTFEGVGNVALGSTIVAYSVTSGGVDFFNTSVIAYDLMTGRLLYVFPATTSTERPESVYFVKALVMTPSGSVAWIGSKFSFFGFQTIYEVHTALTSGATALLDQGPSIVRGSLRLSDGVVSWTNAGARRSAPLP